MKKFFKRSTAILLAMIMIVSTMALTAVAQGTDNGFGQENGNWYYYKNSQIDTSRNDVIRGTVNGQDGWWYVVGGKVQLNYTGVCDYPNEFGWWYVKNGKVDFSKNSVEQNSYGWWYVTGGQVRFDYTGVADYANAYGWWYIKNGKVDFSKTGVEQNSYGWWRVENGKVNFSCNSVEENQYGWWYIVGGQVQFGYTGVADYANAYGWWYIRDGKVDFGKTGVEQNKNGWWRVVNGKVDFSCNSVEENQYGWWYVVGGKVQFGYTGVANYANAYGWWYINGGQVDFSFTGLSSNNYGSWYVVNGGVDFTSTVYDVNHLSQKQGNMLAPISCLYMCAGTGPYNWSDLDLVWWAVSMMANRYPGEYCNVGYGPVTGDALKECWSAMFIGFDGRIPSMEKPGAGYNYSGCTYDGTYYYLGAFDGWGDTFLYFDSWVEHADGSCTVEVRVKMGNLPDYPNGIVKEIDRVYLVKNTYTESMSDPTFIYTIASSEQIG